MLFNSNNYSEAVGINSILGILVLSWANKTFCKLWELQIRQSYQRHFSSFIIFLLIKMKEYENHHNHIFSRQSSGGGSISSRHNNNSQEQQLYGGTTTVGTPPPPPPQQHKQQHAVGRRRTGSATRHSGMAQFLVSFFLLGSEILYNLLFDYVRQAIFR